MKRRLALLTSLSFMFASAAMGDIIVFKDGREIEGQILRETDDKITVRARGVQVDFRMELIQEIRKSEPWRNSLVQAESRFIGSQIARGFELLQQSLDEGAPTREVAVVYTKNQIRITQGITDLPSERRAETSRALRFLTATDKLTTGTLYRVAQDFYRLEDLSSAGETIEKLSPEALDNLPAGREFAMGLMRSLVNQHLRRGEFERAIYWIEAMRGMDDGSSNAQQQRALAMLATAAAARKSEDWHQAFSTLTGYLHESFPELSRNRVDYTIEAMKVALNSDSDLEEALDAIEILADHFPVHYYTVRMYLITIQARRIVDQGDHSRLYTMIDAIPEEERTQELQGLYTRAIYTIKLKELKENDPIELLELGRWCSENDLFEEAVRHLHKARDNGASREIADQLIRNLRAEQDTYLLEKAQEAYDLGQTGEAIQYARTILNNPERASALAAEAEKILEIANASLARDREARPYRAEVLFQIAERAYFQGNLEEAYNTLELVITSFAGTPAADRAINLRPAVLRGFEIAILEGKKPRLPTLESNFDEQLLQEADKLDSEIKKLMETIQGSI